MKSHAELVRQIVPLWYANMAWAKELLMRAFHLEEPEDILRPNHRGRRHIPGTCWFMRTHGVGVDIFKTPEVGGIDFDFDKPDPDSWRLRIFFEKQVNDGSLPYCEYKDLVEDEMLLEAAIKEVLGEA